MSISHTFSLSLLSLALIASNALGMDDKTASTTTVTEQTSVAGGTEDISFTEATKLSDKLESLKKEIEALSINKRIISYLTGNTNNHWVAHVGIHAAIEALAWDIRTHLNYNSLTDGQRAHAERCIDYIVKASRSHLAAVGITAAMNASKNTKYGQKILSKDKEYHANAYASLIASVSAQLLVDRYGNDGFACAAAPYIAGTVAGVAVGSFAPQKAFLN